MDYLINNEGNKLVNKGLVREINKIYKEFSNVRKSTWTVAKSVAAILEKKYWKGDFNNINELCDYLGFGSVSSFSEYKKAVRLTERLNKIHCDNGGEAKIESYVPLTNIIEAMKADKDEDACVDWIYTNLDFISTHTASAVRELVGEHKNLLLDTDEDEESDTESDLGSDEVREEISDELSCIIMGIGSTDYIVITYKGVAAQIPVRRFGKIAKDFPLKG